MKNKIIVAGLYKPPNLSETDFIVQKDKEADSQIDPKTMQDKF